MTAVAVKEGIDAWRGEACDCAAVPLSDPGRLRVRSRLHRLLLCGREPGTPVIPAVAWTTLLLTLAGCVVFAVFLLAIGLRNPHLMLRERKLVRGAAARPLVFLVGQCSTR